MSLPSTAVYELRPPGNGASDSNGGFFNAARGAVDYSQQDSPVLSLTDVVTTTGSATATSATGGLTGAMLGNGITIAGQLYEITAVGSSNSFTLDRTVAAGATGQAGAVGGALASPGKVSGLLVAGNGVWQRTGTYTISTTTANVSGGPVSLGVGGGSDSAFMFWRGYNTTRGDLSPNPNGLSLPTLQVAASGVTGITLFNLGLQLRWSIENVVVDGNGKASVAGFSNVGDTQRLVRCTAKNFTGTGVSLAAAGRAFFCQATAGTATGFQLVGGSHAFGCVSNANAGFGFVVGANARASRCLAANNTGASSDGFICSGVDAALFEGCTSYNNGRNGFYWESMAYGNPAINCLSAGNAAYGFNAQNAQPGAALFNCAAGLNTSGARGINLTLTEGFINLTADPFVDAPNGNFGLNNVGDAFGQTTGLTGVIAGRYLRGAGLGTFPGLSSTVGYPDIGAVQHQDSGGGLLFGAGFDGGYE